MFLTRFGQIRKLTLKRTGVDVSSPVLPVAPPLPYWLSMARDTRVRVQPDILEKFKTNRRFQTKLSTQRRLNTKRILLI
jgi:hypothetical protein